MGSWEEVDSQAWGSHKLRPCPWQQVLLDKDQTNYSLLEMSVNTKNLIYLWYDETVGLSAIKSNIDNLERERK
jgi:hypothetical protein